MGADFEQAMRALRTADAKQRTALLLIWMAQHALAQDELAEAQASASEALLLAQKLERSSDLVLARALLVEIALRRGDQAGAERERGELVALGEREPALSHRARQASERVAAFFPASAKRRKARGKTWNA